MRVFDTTLRDGEQSPGVNLSPEDKLIIARQLSRLGVDIIEAGFPAASPGELEAIKRISAEVGQGLSSEGEAPRENPPVIAAMARANLKDIDKAWEAVKAAKNPRVHVVMPTSDIHLKYKLGKSRDEVLEATRKAVSYAKQFCDDIEFSAEDSTRSDQDYLCRVLDVAVECGANTLNIPDTVGYSMPEEYGELIRMLFVRYGSTGEVFISTHCHNDLGVATANTLAGIANGARQIEVTVNGIGERAGNACLVETAMALYTRESFFGTLTSINKQEIGPSSRMVSELTGMRIQANKAITGANAFLHESGIHQDGILKNRSTYEIMNADELGLSVDGLVLGKHSGRSALRARLEKMGYLVDKAQLDDAFEIFKYAADRHETVNDELLHGLCAKLSLEIREPAQ